MDRFVSVIIPSYNSQSYIISTIESVLNQTYNNFEIIIVDDCSTDRSYEMIGELQKKNNRIKLYRLEKNSGMPSVPRNYGLSKAAGAYIAFLDSDDIWHPQKLEIQIGVMERTGIQFTSTVRKVFIEDSDIKTDLNKKYSGENFKSIAIDHKRLLKKNIIPNSSVVVKKELLDNTAFIEDIRYRAVEDYHCWLKIHSRGIRSIKIQLPLMLYRKAATSISKNKLDMFRKVNILLQEYRINDKPVGFKRYYYLTTYILKSMFPSS